MTAVCCVKGADFKPANSIDFEFNSANFLYRTDGSLNTQIFAISVWIDAESSAVTSYIFKTGLTNAVGFSMYFDTNDRITILGKNSGATPLQIIKTGLNLASYTHIYYINDSTQATEADRGRLYINGTLQTYGGGDSYSVPAQNGTLDSSSTLQVGTSDYTAGGDSDYLAYQLAVFSGSYPSITDVYSSTTPKVKGINNLTGLSYYLACQNGVVTTDAKASTNWTASSNAPVSSTSIPT